MSEVVFYASSIMMGTGILLCGIAMYRMDRVFKRMEKLERPDDE